MLLKSLSPQYFKRLNIKYALALTFIAIVLLSSSFLIQKSIDDNSADSRVINISGRQRMLSQKISKTALIINNYHSGTVAAEALAELNEAVQLFVLSHNALQHGNLNIGLPTPHLSHEVSKLFQEIQPHYQHIVMAANNINNKIASADSSQVLANDVIMILSNEKRFLPLMDKITFTFDKEAKEKIDRLKNIENMILVIGFLVILFEFFSIFRPSIKELILAVKHINEKHEQLRDANKALEYSLEESKRLTELANSANEAKSIFLANMSHEIRTPMNSILGFAEILDTKIENPVHKHYLSNMISSGRMLLSLINDILDLSKIEAGKLAMNYQSVNIHKVSSEIAQTFRHMAENKGLDFSFTIDPDIPKGLLLDEVRLRQILFNLLGNAVKFTDRGFIALNVAIQGISEKQSTYNILFEIQDTGIGISKDSQKKIFDAFEQQSKQDHRKYGGTGLGLSITQKLVALMSGEIMLESQPHHGSKFTVRIDHIPVASVVKEDMPKMVSYTFNPAKVLIVDDVEVNRELLGEYLADQPFEITYAENGQDALVRIDKDAPDIILTDMRMPVMDGFALAAKLKSDPLRKDIPIVAVTASSIHISEEEIKKVCDDYLQKPVSGRKLFKTLAKFLKADGKEENNFSVDDVNNDCECEKTDVTLILEILDDKFIQKLNEQTDILSYDEISNIHKQIKQAASISRCAPLLAWSEEVEGCLALFDMEKLEEKFKQFETIINILKEKK